MYTMAPKLRNSKKTVRLKVMILSMLKRRLPFPQFFGSNRIKLLLSLIMFFGVWVYDEECNCSVFMMFIKFFILSNQSSSFNLQISRYNKNQESEFIL